jgi:uncharacterized protein (DUF433 family)
MALPLRALPARMRARTYTPTEAAVVTGVPLTRINHYISRDLSSLGVAKWGAGKRSLRYEGLVALRMAHDYPKCLTAAARVEVIGKALKSPRKRHIVIEDGKVIIPVSNSRRVVSEGMDKLRQAKAMVSVDKRILGGEPCFKGTRMPVATVAGIANHYGIDEAKRAYSKLTKSQIELAQLYAKAYPRRGRPKRVGDVFSSRKAKSAKTISVTVD